MEDHLTDTANNANNSDFANTAINVNTIIEVEVEVEDPFINPVTVIDVQDTETIIPDDEHEPTKPVLPSIFRLEKRLLMGTFLLIFLIFPTLGAGYIKYRLRNEMYKSVVLDDEFPLVEYESVVPIVVDNDSIQEYDEEEDEYDF